MFRKKILFYLLSVLLAIFATYLAVSVISHTINKVLFFSAFLIAVTVSAILASIWQIKHKNLFESLLCFISLSLICINAISLSPLYVDRSLSVFVYLYSVENKTIPKDIFNEQYYKKYANRRIQEAEKMYFLKCDENACAPTIKSKIAYFILVPVAKITNSFANYKEFKDAITK